MNAYQKGYRDAGTREDRARTYQTHKAEEDYWKGYIQGMRDKNPGPDVILLRCEREGRIFYGVDSDTYHVCPTCARLYEKQRDGTFMADRLLTILE